MTYFLSTYLAINPGPRLMKNHQRANKYESIIQEVKHIEANPDYAHVRLPDGHIETSVSICHLAPRGDGNNQLSCEFPGPMISRGDGNNQLPCGSP